MRTKAPLTGSPSEEPEKPSNVFISYASDDPTLRDFIFPNDFISSRVDTLRKNLAEVQDQLKKMQSEAATNADVASQVRTLSQLVEKAQEHSQDLKAPILLPRPEDMQVRLVASHLLDRLEEYRSDESRYYLFVGLFGGAILGVLSNWFTNEPLTVTRFSIIFIILLALLTGGCSYMVMTIQQRARTVQDKMFGSHVTAPKDNNKMATSEPANERPC